MHSLAEAFAFVDGLSDVAPLARAPSVSLRVQWLMTARRWALLVAERTPEDEAIPDGSDETAAKVLTALLTIAEATDLLDFEPEFDTPRVRRALEAARARL